MQNLYCPKCGQNLNGNTNLKFCPKCGAKIQTNISGNNKKQDDIDKLMNSDFIQMIKRDYFSYTGRLNRKIYFIRSLVLVVIECILFVLIDELDTRSDDFSLILMLGQFTRNYTQTVKRAADNKRRYAPGEGSIPPVLLSGVSKGVPPLAHDFACKV